MAFLEPTLTRTGVRSPPVPPAATTPGRLKPRVTTTQCAAFLRARFGAGADNVLSLSKGEWSQAFACCLANTDCVVRFGAHADDYERDRLAAACGSPRLRIPRVLEIGQVGTGYYAMSERLSGRHLYALGSVELRIVLPSLLRVIDAVRSAPLPGSAGYGIWGADGVGGHESWPVALVNVATDNPDCRSAGWRRNLVESPISAAV